MKRKPGRPKLISKETLLLPESPRTSRSSTIAYNRNLYIICQEDRGPTHFVRFNSTGKRMFDVAKVLTDKRVDIRMNSIPCASDAVANDVRYH